MAWTLEEVPDLRGRVAVVTGANGGLGFQAARVLAHRGAHVVMAVRSLERGAEAQDAIAREQSSASLELASLDLASLVAVRGAGTRLAAAHPRIDILLNNAGVMATPRRTTPDGHELQLAVNHLGHFVLTQCLLASIAASDDGRIVSLTSTGRFFSRPIALDDPTMERAYDPWLAYGRSKLATLQFAIELDARLRAVGSGVRSMAADPGFARTDLQARSAREEPGLGQRFFHAFVRAVGSSALRGAMPALRAATDPGAERGGLYGLRFMLRGDPVSVRRLRGSHLDVSERAAMWAASEELTGQTFDVAAILRGG